MTRNENRDHAVAAEESFDTGSFRNFRLDCSDWPEAEQNAAVTCLKGNMLNHKNLGNLVQLGDLSLMSGLEVAIDLLAVETVVICGHYGCLGIREAVEPQPAGIAGNWLNPVRRLASKLDRPGAGPFRGSGFLDQLSELNVIEQAYRAASTPVAIDAWRRGQALTIRGLMFDKDRNGFVEKIKISSPGEANEAHERAFAGILNAIA
ncbi:hypothetical protein BH10ACI2_BH10ACI2_18030 [soil metagenome]